MLNPLDVVSQVMCVYRELCAPCYPDGWDCPYDVGDANCDGTVNPVDVVYYVNYIYKGLGTFCEPPCIQ